MNNILTLLLGYAAYIPEGAEGIIDADLPFATAQAIPTDGADDLSENYIDLGLAAPNAGAKGDLKVKVNITTTFTVASGTGSILDLVLVSAATDTTTIAAATEHGIVGQLEYVGGAWPTAGETFTIGGIPAKPQEDYLRYLALVLQPRGDDTLFSAGAIDAYLSRE